jgi:hypothetical protein
MGLPEGSPICFLYLSKRASREYLPLPRKNTTRNSPKYRIGNSFTEKGSAAWTTNAATNMTIINGIEANLLLNPRITIYTKHRYQCIISGNDEAIVSFILNDVLVARSQNHIPNYANTI